MNKLLLEGTPNKKQEEFFLSTKRHIAYGGARGGGKAQPLDEPVLTKNGFVKMGSLNVGDFVIGKDGQEVKVLEIHKQGIQKHFKITTIDGASTRCSEGHLWDVKVSGNKKRKVLETRELFDLFNKGKNILIPILKTFNGGVSDLQRRIVNIEPIEDLECQCLTVEGSLYVTKDYIVTHNSWAMRRKFVLLCLQYPGIQCLLLRRTLPELRENHQLPLQRELYGFVKYNSDEKSFVFPNGSRIRLGYCDTEGDVYQYQGQEYDIIGLEEATHFTESQKDFLLTCNRSTRTDIHPRMYYTSNPGNIGHAWFKRLFIDREYRNKERPEDYEFIQALVYDNDVLMDANPEYVESLENLPEDMKKAMLYGDWNVFEGQFFSEFDSTIHIMTPFKIPEDWRIYRTLDYGLDKCACYWIAQSSENRFYVIDELYESELIVSEASKKILEIDNKWLERTNGKTKKEIEVPIAPPDIWSRDGTTGKSAADLFFENGVNWYKGNNDRVNGWLSVKEMLKIVESKDIDSGETIKDCQLKVFNTCTNLIRTLPQVQHDNLKPNDIAKNPHELTHGPDALRMFCMYWISGGDTTYVNKPAVKQIKWTKDMREDYDNGSEYIRERMVEKYGKPN